MRGKHIETGEIEPTIPIDELPLPAVVYYEPYPFIDRQTAQVIEDTMSWLGLPIHTGAYIIAHCLIFR